METKTKYQYADEDGNVQTFEHIEDTCRCACYHGCYPDTLIAKEFGEDDRFEKVKLEFWSGKVLISDLIKIGIDAGAITKVKGDKNDRN